MQYWVVVCCRADSVTDDQLEWVETTGSNYDNWAAGTPNMTTGRRDCGSFNTGITRCNGLMDAMT